MNIQSFKQGIATQSMNTKLDISSWKDEGWKNLYPGLTQEVLNDAFNQHGTVRSIFSNLGEITARKCKNMARVEKKMTEQAPGRENYFKVVSDLVAIRVHCEVPQIAEKIDSIRKSVLAEGGVMYVRGASEQQPNGAFMSPEGKYKDITQYVYVFMEKVGYPVEIQIGHPFASHTFTIDSALRDDPTCGKVDLWKDDFYPFTRDFILKKANGEDAGYKAIILNSASELHMYNVPEDLKAILDTI